jgi:hypothetical protein
LEYQGCTVFKETFISSFQNFFNVFKNTTGIRKKSHIVSETVILGSSPLAAALFVRGADLEVYLTRYFD